MKISIRTSIIALFFSFFIVAGFLIITTNYLVLNDILFKSAQKSLLHVSKQFVQQMLRYFHPLDERVNLSEDLIDQNIIEPGVSEKFRKYLLKTIYDNPSLHSAYWGDPQGNLYLVERNAGNTFLSVSIQHQAASSELSSGMLNRNGEYIGTVQHHLTTWNPQERPWYKAAEKIKKHVWTLYLFSTFLGEKPVMGLTSAIPVYSADGKLKGVFGIDMTLDSISKYLLDFKLSKNTVVFICNDRGELIASMDQDIRKHDDSALVPKIDALSVPWAAASYTAYQKGNHWLFSYKYNNDRYIAAYIRIPAASQENWYVVIVIPEFDILASLREVTYISILATVMVFLVGFLVIYWLSGRISRPITELEKDAKKIEKFELDTTTKMNSSIAEISRIQQAFNAMKAGLSLFRHYLPVSLVKQLVTHSLAAKVGGVKKNLTFLSIDINEFSSLAEDWDPNALMTDLSDYFDALSRVILQEKGVVDKYLGDELMAFWNAPIEDSQHAKDACRCALKIKPVLQEINQRWKKSNRHEISIRIGINTGLAIVGNVGSREVWNYTAISDSVNLTLRLQELNKLYHTYCVVSESTYQEAKDDFEFRLLDLVTIRGRHQGIYVYELLGEKGSSHFSQEDAYRETFEEAFRAYREGQFQEAVTLFEKLKSDFPQDTLAVLFLERCRLLMESPVRNWNGIWVINPVLG